MINTVHVGTGATSLAGKKASRRPGEVTSRAYHAIMNELSAGGNPFFYPAAKFDGIVILSGLTERNERSQRAVGRIEVEHGAKPIPAPGGRLIHSGVKLMAKSHGARQQKRAAKQKAKRSEKRSVLFQRTTKDPTIRLRDADKWPVVQAVTGTELWKDGIGYLAIARQDPEGLIAFGVFLVDVYCLGVKNAFWQIGTRADLDQLIAKMGQTQTVRAIAPACLVKIVKGAVDYALSFGVPPHSDFRHASLLLEGIDPATCPEQFTFGKDGKPFYIQGPNESPAQAKAIMDRIYGQGGHFLVQMSAAEYEESPDSEDEF
jgi:hypothetical protein